MNQEDQPDTVAAEQSRANGRSENGRKKWYLLAVLIPLAAICASLSKYNESLPVPSAEYPVANVKPADRSASPDDYVQIDLPTLPFEVKKPGTELVVGAVIEDSFGSRQELGRLHDFEQKLEAALAANDSGHWDGEETGSGEHNIFFVGDIGRMFQALAPVLNDYPWRTGSYLEFNYGKPTYRMFRLSLPLRRKSRPG
jgi:hypothetical protein